MILGLGADLVEVQRIRSASERFGQQFLKRIFTAAEQAYCFSKANSSERLAARFAAKEAGMKALGTGWGAGVTFLDFEVTNNSSGQPVLTLYGRAAKISRDLGVSRISVSLTHTAQLGFAVVIFEGESRESLDGSAAGR